MTDRMRAKIARSFRHLLDRGVHRKEALRSVMEKYGVSRPSVYRYCKVAGVSTA